MWESKWVKAAAIVVLVVATAGAVVWAMRSVTAEPASIITGDRWVACSACKHQFKGPLPERPGTCPACQARALWPAMRCTSCDKIVPVDVDRFDSELRKPYCLECGAKKLEPVERRTAAAARPGS